MCFGGGGGCFVCAHACTRHVSVHAQPKHTCGGRRQLWVAWVSETKLRPSGSPGRCSHPLSTALWLTSPSCTVPGYRAMGILASFVISLSPSHPLDSPMSHHSLNTSPVISLPSSWPFFIHSLCSSPPALSEQGVHRMSVFGLCTTVRVLSILDRKPML